MAIATQLYLLQYKSWKLQFRKKLVTIFELLIPVVLCLLLVLIRSQSEVVDHPEATVFPSRLIDSLPFSSLQLNPLKGSLAYAPKTSVTDQIMAGLRSSIKISSKFQVFSKSYYIV